MRKLLFLLSVLVVQTVGFATVCEHGVHAQWDSWLVGETFNGYDTFTPDSWCYDVESTLSIQDSPDSLVYRGVSYVESLGGRSGILLLNGVGFENMGFFMPNYVGGDKKEITVRVTYQSTGFSPVLGVNGYINDEIMTGGIYSYGRTSQEIFESNWVTDTYEFTIVPNCDYEFITLGFENSDNYSIALDSVTIDTVCVPEPATLVFMALSSLIMLKKSK